MNEHFVGTRATGTDAGTYLLTGPQWHGEAPDGVWVSGLDGEAEVIVRGQDFVASGQKVAIARDEGGATDRNGASAASQQTGGLRK